MKKNELAALEALAKTLAVRVEDILRLLDHPAARVTVSAPGGFHVQSKLAEVVERHLTALSVGKAPKPAPVAEPKPEPAIAPVKDAPVA